MRSGMMYFSTSFQMDLDSGARGLQGIDSLDNFNGVHGNSWIEKF
jgi:hypothetical protein